MTTNGFVARTYDVYLLLSDPIASPLWQRDIWAKATPGLSALMASPRGNASVRMLQLQSGLGSPNQRALKFGPLGWNEKSHLKWTHSQPDAAGTSDAIFHSASIWAPGPGFCERQNCPPDTFLAIAQEDSPKDGRQFGYMVALAVAHELEDLVLPAQSAVACLTSLMKPVLAATTRRNWAGVHQGQPLQWTNSIADTFFVSGLFKPGKRHAEPVSTDRLEGAWKLLATTPD